MSSAIVKGFCKFYPVIFHKKGRFAGIFRICGDGELVFEILWGEVALEDQRGIHSEIDQRRDRSPQCPRELEILSNSQTPRNGVFVK